MTIHLPSPDDPLPRCSTETRRVLEAARRLVAPEAAPATAERNRELSGTLSRLIKTLKQQSTA